MFNNKIILLTGGTGSWGTELVTQLLNENNPKEIRIYSRGEEKQCVMRRKFNGNSKLKFIIGDVRNIDRLDSALKEVDIVFHLAALKHIPVCEENPSEAVLTNIIGTQNIVQSSIKNNVKIMVNVSTDKAVDPLNLYGATKACGEKLTIAANNEFGKTKFVCVRGGNVLGTNGSVVPLFREQIITNNEITLTDERMTRFFITLKEAIKLLIKVAENSIGGEIFVLKMPSVKIAEIAEVMIDSLGNEHTNLKKIGIRPGEKIHEVLVSRYEIDRLIEDEEYFIILPLNTIPLTAKHYKTRTRTKIHEYTSENTRRLNKKEIHDLLKKDGWLEKSRIR